MTMKEQQEIEHFCDARYVRRDECIERKENFDKRFANDDKRIEFMERKFGVVEKILWILVSEAAAALVVMLVGMIVK